MASRDGDLYTGREGRKGGREEARRSNLKHFRFTPAVMEEAKRREFKRLFLLAHTSKLAIRHRKRYVVEQMWDVCPHDFMKDTAL